MSRLRWSFFFLGFALLLGGCESTLDWTLPSSPKLTIIAHLTPGGWETPRVYIYASKSPLDSTQFITPTNLEVEVTELESDLTYHLDSTKQGNQVFFEFPEGFLKEGLNYSIKAYAPGYGPAKASTEIPRPSKITGLTLSDIRIEPSDKNEFKNIVHYKLSFNIEHLPSNQYYHLIFYNEYKNLQRPYLIDPALSDDIPFIHSYDFGILIAKKDLQEGKPLEFNFVDWAMDEYNLAKVFVELRSISEDYYKYQASLARQVIIRQDPFAEPVPIFNNIDGGYGNFSGFTPNVSSFEVPQ